MTSKTWNYTLNNYTEQDIEQFKSFVCTRHRCAKEIGESGTPHLQGVITFTQTYRLSGLKKLNNKAHWEKTKNLVKSVNYCTKGEIIIDINNSKQGERTDLSLAIETLKKTGLRGVRDEHPEEYVKFHKGLKALIYDDEGDDIPIWTDVEVLVFWGEPGCGKTRKCWELDENLYTVPTPSGNGCLWFDGYKDQETILFDDFYGWIKYDEIIRLLDGYRMRLQVKGGFVQKRWKRVLMTSNAHPEDWYRRNEWTALERRISKITFMGKTIEDITTSDEL